MSPRPPLVVCIGGATVDRTYRTGGALMRGTSNPVVSTPPAFGGVARNVAETLCGLGTRVALVSVVGKDENGGALLRQLEALGIESRLFVLPDHRTAEYIAVLEPSGELAFGLADMSIFGAFSTDHLEEAGALLAGAAFVFADCNLPAAVLRHLIARRRQAPWQLAVDAVSVAKSARLPADLDGIDCLFMNRDEARAYLGAASSSDAPEDLAGAMRERGVRSIVLTLGAEGALLVQEGRAPLRLPAFATEVVDVTGAGDALIAGTLMRLAEGASLEEALPAGLAAAALTIASAGSVRQDLTRDLLERAGLHPAGAPSDRRHDG